MGEAVDRLRNLVKLLDMVDLAAVHGPLWCALCPTCVAHSLDGVGWLFGDEYPNAAIGAARAVRA